MKNKSIVTFICLIISFNLFGQDTSILRRAAYRLTVVVDDKSVYEENLKETPYVLPNQAIQLYPGETVFVEIEQMDGIIKTITAVKEIKDSSKTLTISFIQIAKMKIHESMMLKVENPFSYKLVYKTKIFLLRQNKWIDTEVYPVEAKLTGYETWPDIITSIGLGNWSFQPK